MRWGDMIESDRGLVGGGIGIGSGIGIDGYGW